MFCYARLGWKNEGVKKRAYSIDVQSYFILYIDLSKHGYSIKKERKYTIVSKETQSSSFATRDAF